VTTTRFLDPHVLSRIANLEILARTVVDGFINGLHHSPYFGLSVDFAEHRPYMPGDDIRRVDWKVFGRTDRFYVKEFEADTNANFSILFDTSGSMRYGSHGITKLDYGRYLAACLAYFSRQQRDRVGIVTFREDVLEYVPCSAKHLDVVLHTIDRIEAKGEGKFEEPLLKVAEILRRRSILVLISDLYDEPDTILKALNRRATRGTTSSCSTSSIPPRSISRSTNPHSSKTWRVESGFLSYPRHSVRSIVTSCHGISRHSRRGWGRTGLTTASSTLPSRWITRCSSTWRAASG
jgi:uncharacterized protein (DUF58 family)